MMIFCLIVVVASQLAPPQVPSVWPWPSSINITTEGAAVAYLSPSQTLFTCESSFCHPALLQAIERSRAQTFFADPSRVSPVQHPVFSVRIVVLSPTMTPADETFNPQWPTHDESYQMQVSVGLAILTANTEYGALYALTSFAQIVEFDVVNDAATNPFFYGSYTIKHLPLSVVDAPRFAWRGLLLDTSRHFISMANILSVIDGIAANKMNVFHFHAVDDHSHPLYSQTYPDLSLKGAWRPYLIYTTEELRMLVRYAADRGVRVILELDMPAHATSWGKGHPEIIVYCDTDSGSERDTLFDPRDHTYDFLSLLFEEMVSIFPSVHFHIGFDEVVYACWEQSEEITAWRTSMGFTSWEEVHGYFLANIQAIIHDRLNRTSVIWHEGFVADIGARSDTIVQVWRGYEPENALVEALRAGHYVLYSRGFYLDQMVPQKPPPSMHYFMEDTWKDFYRNDPYNRGEDDLTEEEKTRVIGGEGCAWAEQMDDNSIQPRIFARVAAIAENLWSPRTVTDSFSSPELAASRFVLHRCNLVRRFGLKATPLTPDYCDDGLSLPDAYTKWMVKK